MNSSTRWHQFLLKAAVLLVPLATVPHANSQAVFPSKPIVVRMAYPAGGPADASLRDFIPTLQRELGQPVVVENMPGANGSIAAMSVLKAPPDGYTLLGTVTSDLILAPMVIPTAKYKPQAFRAVGFLGSGDLVLLSSPQHDFKNADQLIERAKATGKELSIGHWGTGSLTHVVSADFAASAGIKLLQVPYKGAAPVIPDLGSGQIDLSFFPVAGSVVQMIKSGLVKAVAVASEKRNPQLPDVPTMNESKYLKNFQYAARSGTFAPPGTPDAVVARLNKAMNAYIASAEGRARQVANGASVLDPVTMEQMTQMFLSESQEITKAAKAIGP